MIGLRARYGLRKLQDDAVRHRRCSTRRWTAARSTSRACSRPTASSRAGATSLLADPKGVFAKQHVAPLISRKALAEHGPQLAQTLNAVSALLTTPVMRDLNAKADRQRSPAAVADEFLRAHGLSSLPRRERADPGRGLRRRAGREVLPAHGARGGRRHGGRLDDEHGRGGARRRSPSAQPDILLLDLVLPDVPEPADLVRDLRQRAPAMAILLMSNMPASRLQAEAERIGTDGWMPKAHKPELLRETVREIVAGQA